MKKRKKVSRLKIVIPMEDQF
uniref:Uncharacterized protein n=1 Tax=Physcomitrium patens TaxID=3218 RepID=A0A2K1IZR2_PHYPA|nr:hypothetical protein PHYPA_022647 [Physcomitrium patens]